jgi:hypothetical protein
MPTPEYVLVAKPVFEKMVSDRAEQLQRTVSIEWGEPSDFNDLDGVFFNPTITVHYPDEPPEGSPG